MKRLFLLILLVIAPHVSVLAQETLQFGVFPHLPKHKLYEMYHPVAKNFEQVTGHKVVVRTMPNFVQFEQALREEVFDIALIQPFDYPTAHDNHHYLPLANRENPLAAIVVVEKDSSFENLKDLKGKTIANPAKSAAVTILGARMLRAQGISPEKGVKRVFKNNHFSCLQTVLIKRAQACVTSRRALHHYNDEKVGDRFRILAESEKVPHVIFVAHKRVAESVREVLKHNILNWKNTERGREILKGGRLFRFKEATDAEYDVIREK